MALPDIIGITGVALILYTYFMLQIEKIKSTQLSYSLLNLIGSIFIFYSLLHTWNMASVIIEAAWIAISLYGVYKWVKRRGKTVK